MGVPITISTPGTSIVDFSAGAGVVYTLDAPKAGKIDVSKCFGNAEEAIGDATTQGVMSIEVDDVEIASYTTLGTEAIGDRLNFSPDGTYTTTVNPYYTFAAGAKIEVVLKTQATGGTTTGTARVRLYLMLAD